MFFHAYLSIPTAYRRKQETKPVGFKIIGYEEVVATNTHVG